MTHSRSLGLVAAFLILAVTSVGSADPLEKSIVWDPVRTTSPDSVPELKAMQERVKKVVEKGTPSTVGLLVGMGSKAGAGSGVIVSEDGLVLTAAHVIWDSRRERAFKTLVVVLPDGTKVAGKSLGVNPKIDSGMVQITGKPPKDATWPGAKDGKWPASPIGKTSDLKKGQWVVSLGHPGGPKEDRKPPLRVGRVENMSPEDYSLQTDCTLVGGDSGGPLFDLNGKVVGIHSRIGLLLKYNIHVPIETYQNEWDRLAKEGEVISVGSDLGVTLDEEADEVMIASVETDGPADKAELKKGDVIVSFNGDKIQSADDLVQKLLETPPKTKVSIEILRAKKTITKEVTLGKKNSKK